MPAHLPLGREGAPLGQQSGLAVEEAAERPSALQRVEQAVAERTGTQSLGELVPVVPAVPRALALDVEPAVGLVEVRLLVGVERLQHGLRPHLAGPQVEPAAVAGDRVSGQQVGHLLEIGAHRPQQGLRSAEPRGQRIDLARRDGAAVHPVVAEVEHGAELGPRGTSSPTLPRATSSSCSSSSSGAPIRRAPGSGNSTRWLRSRRVRRRPPRERRPQDQLAARDRVHGPRDLALVGPLQQVAAGTGLQGGLPRACGARAGSALSRFRP